MRLIISLILSLAGAVGLGYGLFLLDSQGFYLVGLMPLVGGAIVGFLARWPIPLYWTRSAPIILNAMIAALVMMGVYWYLQFESYNSTIVAAIQEQDSSVTREEALKIIDEVQMETYQTTGFTAFVMDYAEIGFSVGRVGSSEGSQLEIQGNLAYGFWIFEIVVAVGMAAFSARNRNKLPPPPKPAVETSGIQDIV